ncbi:Hypothetical protein SAMN05444064_105150 [Pseudomonas syringae]|uniref:DUF2513 domain-containing protein n=1 Tax=Pseudomonas syringae TaxID=317 RepID=UPI0008951752|nr:DUF2513 domain-containing protein [Pseudomonas syringae]SDW62817.1 Hypothetical protein SAMN05444514_105150 [Pseudomonas syringae]SFL86062.1 Hypothetical protein SAMN05444064_105150 [Pseudomonas syringae]
MKRDWDLIRLILIAVEENEDHNKTITDKDIPGHDPVLVAYQMLLLKEAGLINAECVEYSSEPRECFVFDLTWEGHEFLDQIKSKTLWNKTVGVIQEKGLDLSFSTIKAAAAAVAKSLINF